VASVHDDDGGALVGWFDGDVGVVSEVFDGLSFLAIDVLSLAAEDDVFVVANRVFIDECFCGRGYFADGVESGVADTSRGWDPCTLGLESSFTVVVVVVVVVVIGKVVF